MKRIIAMGFVALLLMAPSATVGWAQAENLSASRGLGVGVRFLPQALMPTASSDLDPGLGSALVVQYWFNDLMGVEAGGWVSGFSDNINPHSLMSLSAGIFYKLADNAEFDPYVAGRAISLQSTYTNCCIIYDRVPPPTAPQPRSQGQNDKIAPPWPSSESRNSTLAVEIAAGIERSWSPQVTTNLEFGLVYAQTMMTNIAPPAIETPVPIERSQRETSASSSFGITMHLSVNFYLLRK